MSKRVTIMMDDDLDKKVRLVQAKKITKILKSTSFSRTINDLLRQGL